MSWPIGPATSQTPASPARAPLVSSANQTTLRALKPAKEPADGVMPITRIWKPIRVREISTQAAATANRASSADRLTRDPSNRTGSMPASGKILDSGKLNPVGSR